MLIPKSERQILFVPFAWRIKVAMIPNKFPDSQFLILDRFVNPFTPVICDLKFILSDISNISITMLNNC